MLLAWLLAQQTPDPPIEGLGPYIAFGSLALLVIAGLAKAFVTQRSENKELNDRVFQIVEKVEPLLHEVAGALKDSTRAVERSGSGRDR